jgi:hypothetical protein
LYYYHKVKYTVPKPTSNINSATYRYTESLRSEFFEPNLRKCGVYDGKPDGWAPVSIRIFSMMAQLPDKSRESIVADLAKQRPPGSALVLVWNLAEERVGICPTTSSRDKSGSVAYLSS